MCSERNPNSFSLNLPQILIAICNCQSNREIFKQFMPSIIYVSHKVFPFVCNCRDNKKKPLGAFRYANCCTVSYLSPPPREGRRKGVGGKKTIGMRENQDAIAMTKGGYFVTVVIILPTYNRHSITVAQNLRYRNS